MGIWYFFVKRNAEVKRLRRLPRTKPPSAPLLFRNNRVCSARQLESPLVLTIFTCLLVSGGLVRIVTALSPLLAVIRRGRFVRRHVIPRPQNEGILLRNQELRKWAPSATAIRYWEYETGCLRSLDCSFLSDRKLLRHLGTLFDKAHCGPRSPKSFEQLATQAVINLRANEVVDSELS